MRKAMEKANFKSLRGNVQIRQQPLPIQNFYLQDAWSRMPTGSFR